MICNMHRDNNMLGVCLEIFWIAVHYFRNISSAEHKHGLFENSFEFNQYQIAQSTCINYDSMCTIPPSIPCSPIHIAELGEEAPGGHGKSHERPATHSTTTYTQRICRIARQGTRYQSFLSLHPLL